MKTTLAINRFRQLGFTGVDFIGLTVGAFIIVMIAFTLLPHRHHGSARIKCVSNLKQIGLAFRIFANDNNEHYPFQTEELYLYGKEDNPAGQGGNPLIYGNTELETWCTFQVLSNELSSAKMLLCPTDRLRLKTQALNFFQDADSLSTPGNRNQSISYFVGLQADETRPQAILTGDRNITGPGATGPALSETAAYISGGTHLFGPDSSVGAQRRWAMAKKDNFHDGQGNLGLADGSVQQVSGKKLEDQLELSRQNYGTNAWLFSFPND